MCNMKSSLKNAFTADLMLVFLSRRGKLALLIQAGSPKGGGRGAQKGGGHGRGEQL